MGWDGNDGNGCAAAAFHREAIHERIEYDILLQNPAINKSRLDEIVDIMVETFCATNDTMVIGGSKYPTALVQERFSMFTFLHIQYFFHCLDKNTSRIRNIKKYLLTALFNAPITMDGYYAAMVNQEYGALPSPVPDEPDDF